MKRPLEIRVTFWFAFRTEMKNKKRCTRRWQRQTTQTEAGAYPPKVGGNMYSMQFMWLYIVGPMGRIVYWKPQTTTLDSTGFKSYKRRGGNIAE